VVVQTLDFSQVSEIPGRISGIRCVGFFENHGYELEEHCNDNQQASVTDFVRFPTLVLKFGLMIH